jgi:hypothetical protein
LRSLPFDNRSKRCSNGSKRAHNCFQLPFNRPEREPNGLKQNHGGRQKRLELQVKNGCASKTEAGFVSPSAAESSPHQHSAMNRKKQEKVWVAVLFGRLNDGRIADEGGSLIR